MAERKSRFLYDDLIACARGDLFGPGNAQSPLPPMLMFDRITHISEDGGEHGKGQIVAELDVKPDLWFFRCHFPGDPVMPGCLGLDALWQMLGFFMGWLGAPGKGRALGVGEVKFTGTNEVGQKFEWHFLRVEFVPSSAISPISDEWGQLEVTGNVVAVAGKFGKILLATGGS